MDELLHHCIRELAFEGDLGCDVTRLQDFITEFYAHSGAEQTVDAAYCAFVWSVVVQHPEVRIGIAPEGALEVYIAPQSGKTTKKKKETQDEAREEDSAVGKLEVIDDAALRPLDDLKLEYGDKLRIAVAPESSLVAITGSHIKPSKLTPMVYTALQLICRGREAGLSAVDLSKKTGYDAKTCHYLIDKLVELNLIEKRKKSGVGTNICIHKYFFERSKLWKGVLAEEDRVRRSATKKEEKDDADLDIDDGDESTPAPAPLLGQLHFEPIDSRHLSSLTIIKDRLEKLLRNSPHNIHTQQNLLVTIGFPNPVKLDRRFFQTRLRELMAQGFIEKVQVPRPGGGFASCIRLANPSETTEANPAPSALEGLDDEATLPSLKTNVTLQKQMIDFIHQSGTEGATLNQLTQALGSFDKRTLDLQLNRLKDSPLPGHVRDLGITQVSESYGRERRYKYFSFANYQKVVEMEQLESPYPEGFFEEAGGFLPVEEDQFYRTDAEWFKYVTGQIKPSKGKGKGKAKADVVPKAPARSKKRKRDDEATDTTADNTLADSIASTSMAPPPPKKRGRPPKNPTSQPAMPPPDVLVSNEGTSASPQIVTLASATPPAPAKKRGRPRKTPVEPTETPVPKKRGRPPKNKAAGMAELVIRPYLPPVAQPEPVPPPPVDGQADSSSNAQEPEPPTAPVRPVAVESDVPSVAVSNPECVADAEDQEADAAEAVVADAEVPELEEEDAPPHESQPVPIPSATTDTPAGSASNNKRGLSPTPSAEAPSKRLKTSGTATGSRVRTNLSQSRREKEMLRLITELGGIANVSSKEFTESHGALLERMIQAGETVSDNRLGSRTDKKTVDATLKALQDQGLIKLITTAVQSRQVRVVYLADMPQEEVNAFLGALDKNAPAPFSLSSTGTTLDNMVSYGGSKTTRVVKPRNSFIFVELEQPPEPDRTPAYYTLSGTKLKEALLTDIQTIKQLYGFISGKIARIQELHLHLMRLLDDATNGHIVASGQRILDVSYLVEDLPISVYCAIVSSQVKNDELKVLLSTPEGRATPLNRISASLTDILEPTKSRSRARILDLLVTLQDMHVITPLLPTDSEHPWLRCPPNGNFPTAFVATHCDGTAPLQAPIYWRLNTSAPIHFWTLDETTPPFWMQATLHSHSDAVDFWHNLQRASLDFRYARRMVKEWRQNGPPPVGPAADIPLKAVRLMRRSTQWRTSYAFSDSQKHVMKRYTDIQTASTPLEDADGGESRLEVIADILSAPKEDVIEFYKHERSRMLHNIEKTRRKDKVEGSKRKTDSDQRANLAQKAAEARAQRDRDWEGMLARVHPEPLENNAVSRIKNLKKRFMQAAGADHQKWEAEIRSTLEQSKLPAKRTTAARIPLVSFNPVQSAQHPAVGRASEKSVEELVALQGPPIAKEDITSKSKKGKEKEKDDTSGKVVRRRHRFAWTKDYEELARDASAVIRARARDCKRLDWTPLEQVFPAIPRNTVRQRIVLLRDQPGAEAYFKRLEDKWYELWTKHRGTPELPDDDPTSMWNFDLIAHITFLREHVDKNALRVGFVESTEIVQSVALPSSLSTLESLFRVSEKPLLAPTFDFMWNNAAEEGREKLLAQQPFVYAPTSSSNVTNGLQACIYPSERPYIGDAALKMTLGTPSETYDADRAADLLKSVGQEAVDVAVKDMLERGVVSKLVRDPKKNKPGRLLKISDLNQNALSGPMAAELFQDACALEEGFCSSLQEESSSWKTWPLTASDGDTAALLELVSEGKVNFEIDTTGPQSARAGLDWNSKKADDDDIETSILLRYHDDTAANATVISSENIDALSIPFVGEHISPSLLSLIQEPHDDGTTPVAAGEEPADKSASSGFDGVGLTLEDRHGRTASGERASCHQRSDAMGENGSNKGDILANCQACVDTEAAKIVGGDDLISNLWMKLVDVGESGITKQELKAFPGEVSEAEIAGSVTCLVDHKLAFWAGYRDIVLVSSHFLSFWAVTIRSETSPQDAREDEGTNQSAAGTVISGASPLEFAFPRRWLDVHGRRISEIWEAACRAVMGIVIFRPGINQAELRWRLRAVYDRHELHDILVHLLTNRYLRVVRSESYLVPDSPADDIEERETFWFIGERRWYDL